MSILKATLFAGSMLLTFAATGYAAAQTNNPQNPTVIVTGTRIPKPNLDQPVPVGVVTQQIIQNAGTPDLGQVIATLPSMGITGAPRSNIGLGIGVNAAGLSFADLRNLGPNRTLVLVDGQRHVAADPGSFAVDLGSIPPALVDRVEIVTGGASAIYGSDALAGVVNIIEKKTFEGVEFNQQFGYYPQGSIGQTEQGYLTVGRNFGADRGNINATLLWDNNAQIVADQVPGAKEFATIVNPIYGTGFFASPVPANGVPERIVVPFANESEFISNTGVLFDAVSFNPIAAFLPNGTPVPQQVRTGSNSLAFGQLANCTTCFLGEQYLLVQAKGQRVGGDVRLSYDITPNLNFSIDEKLVFREVYSWGEPDFNFFQFFLPPDNAFITPAIANVLASSSGFVFINRFLGDSLPRAVDSRRLTERVVPKLTGNFDAKFAPINWDASFNFGESDNWFSQRNIELPGNFFAAEDSVIDPKTGKPACRINVPSAPPDPFNAPPPQPIIGNPAACVPYNPFGLLNSAAAIKYTHTNFSEYQRLDQEVADLNANFDTSRFFNLPGGPLAFAVGAEWRKESVIDNIDPINVDTTNPPTGNFPAVANAPHGFEVTEFYGELSIPVFRHQGLLLDELTFDVADRTANYTTVGNVNAWKVSAIYGPIPGFKLRGDYSIAVRAPNLTEAFLPPSGNFFNVTDPCDAANITLVANRQANCAALLAALGAPPAGTFTDNLSNVSVPGTTGGNEKLTPEKSTSYTFGFVLQPTFAKNFSLTADYYNIDITNAILQVNPQDIVNNCVDGAGLDPTFCSLITRAPTNNFVNAAGFIDQIGDIAFVKQTFVNSQRVFTDGVEIQSTYAFWADPLHFKFSREPGLPGRVTLNVDFNYLMHLHTFPFQTSPNQYQVSEGAEGTPYQRARADITYAQGPFSLTWTFRYVGTAADFSRSPGNTVYAGNAVSPPYFPAIVYNDVIVHYLLPTWQGGKADLYIGANDLFNKVPPPNAITGNIAGPDGSALYDIGLFLFAGAKVRY